MGTAAPEPPPMVDAMSVERLLADADVERTRLQAELAMAQARLAAALQRRAFRDSEGRAAIASLVRSTRDELARLEEEHDRALAAIRAGAREEADRLLAAARGDAAALVGDALGAEAPT